MPDRMSPEEIQELAKAIAEQKGDFYVEPEEHYNQHKQIQRFLNAFEKAGNGVFKFFLGLVLLGLCYAIALALGFSK